MLGLLDRAEVGVEGTDDEGYAMGVKEYPPPLVDRDGSIGR
jgi:hypothetical protein